MLYFVGFIDLNRYMEWWYIIKAVADDTDKTEGNESFGPMAKIVNEKVLTKLGRHDNMRFRRDEVAVPNTNKIWYKEVMDFEK